MTPGKKLADVYRVASKERFEQIYNDATLNKNKLPPNYAESCHIAGAAAIDAALTPWWKKLLARIRR